MHHERTSTHAQGADPRVVLGAVKGRPGRVDPPRAPMPGGARAVAAASRLKKRKTNPDGQVRVKGEPLNPIMSTRAHTHRKLIWECFGEP